ncbi:clavaminate synthase-like protein At3g21360 isoform X3 [Malania oleifera]|uniref:clavaminate synthase-like protein At3g21360 isoform X3 n=1 Tax=Malania oleifera TaxID=397392 RepID=UPI0025AE063A|nr:clavaminate synthase-like protein At3g21360 isoform X3 [Malania oleifera]
MLQWQRLPHCSIPKPRLSLRSLCPHPGRQGPQAVGRSSPPLRRRPSPPGLSGCHALRFQRRRRGLRLPRAALRRRRRPSLQRRWSGLHRQRVAARSEDSVPSRNGSEPASGGETPIVRSHIVYKRMKERYPEFVERLEQHGLLYTRVLGEEDDPSSPIGRGWKSTFLTKDKNTAEERAAGLGMKLEWLEDTVKTIMGPIPAIKFDETRQQKIWFNSMVAAYTGWEDARNDPVKAVTFGDGKPLPADIIYDCLKILDEESVAIPWQRGDVLLLDNLAVLHSRRSFDPPRRVLASLCK